MRSEDGAADSFDFSEAALDIGKAVTRISASGRALAAIADCNGASGQQVAEGQEANANMLGLYYSGRGEEALTMWCCFAQCPYLWHNE
jgi:hypothetical protein